MNNKSNETELKKHRCCFTGHRPEKLELPPEDIKRLLRASINAAIEEGYTTFITGMARGIDMWAAEIVLDERNKNSDIKLVCAVPYNGFEKKWSAHERALFYSIIEKCDFVKYVCDGYSRACYQIRNIYMVDRSSLVIAAFCGEAGGTRNTLDYAMKKGVRVFNILGSINF